MSSPPKIKRSVTYQDLLSVPDTMVGEIINGELIVSPRPSGPNIFAASSLCEELMGPFSKGKRGGPGGWWILVEPEVKFQQDKEHYVPDLAGWRREKMPQLPKEHVFEIVPDWVCEVISPSSRRYDRIKKARIYAANGVGYYWLIEPEMRSLEAFQLSKGSWLSVGIFSDMEKGNIPPFEAMEFDLSSLWADEKTS